MVDGKEVTMQVKAGDKVIYSKYAGNEVKLEDEEYIIVRAERHPCGRGVRRQRMIRNEAQTSIRNAGGIDQSWQRRLNTELTPEPLWRAGVNKLADTVRVTSGAQRQKRSAGQAVRRSPDHQRRRDHRERD